MLCTGLFPNADTKIQKIFNISFVLNKKVLILFNTMDKMNKKNDKGLYATMNRWRIDP